MKDKGLKVTLWKTWEALNDSDIETAFEYLSLAFEKGDITLIICAINNILKAKKLMSKLTKKTKGNRESLYRLLHRERTPNFNAIIKIMAGMGLGLKPYKLSTKYKKAS